MFKRCVSRGRVPERHLRNGGRNSTWPSNRIVTATVKPSQQLDPLARSLSRPGGESMETISFGLTVNEGLEHTDQGG